MHTWYLSRTPRTYSCKIFLAGVNFYRFNAKNWQFTVYFVVITQKIGNFLCILSKNFARVKNMTNIRYARGADTTNKGFAACETCFDTLQVCPPTYMYALEHKQESIRTRTHTHTHNFFLHTNTNIQLLTSTHAQTFLSTILSAKALGYGKFCDWGRVLVGWP